MSTLTVPSFDELKRAIAPLIAELRQTAPDLPEAAVVTAPQQLVRLAGPLPASEAHHDACPLGLVSHSIRVAIRAATLYQQRRPKPDGAEDRRRWEQGLAVVVLAGLVHDVGKIWLMDVQVGDVVLPYGRYLVSWVDEQSSREIAVRWRPGRTRLGPSGHESLSLCLLIQIVPIGLVSWIGSRGMNDLLATLASSLGAEPSDPIYLLVKEADHRVTAESMPVRATQVVSAAPAPVREYIPGTGTIADDFVAGFRAHVDDHRLRFNVPDGQVLISPSHTVLWITTQGVGSIFQIVYEAMRTKALAAGVGGYVASFYSGGKAMSYLDEIASRSTRDGLAWCVPAEDRKPPDGRSIRHWAEVADAQGRRRRTGYAIVVRNRAIWSESGFGERGTFTGFLRLCTDKRGANGDRPASADPEDLGFTPFPEHVRPKGTKPVKISAVVPAHEADAVLDLESVAAQLIHEVAALTGGTDEERPQWGDLVRAAGTRLPDLLVQPALEACLDRLRHLRAAGGITPSIPASAVRAPDPEPELAKQDLTTLVAAAVSAVVLAGRAGPTVDRPSTSAQAVLTPDGSVFLPWPQCLVLGLSATQVDEVRNQADELCASAGLPTPVILSIAGYPYRGMVRTHRGLLVPSTWLPQANAIPAAGAVIYAAQVMPA